ncbi:hypothetical protein GCM10009612_78330 [Streptomyces beijiangensis]
MPEIFHEMQGSDQEVEPPLRGRPPMSQRAVDLNTTILSSSVAIGMGGLAVTGALWASSQANPTVIAWICGCAVGQQGTRRDDFGLSGSRFSSIRSAMRPARMRPGRSYGTRQ